MIAYIFKISITRAQNESSRINFQFVMHLIYVVHLSIEIIQSVEITITLNFIVVFIVTNSKKPTTVIKSLTRL